MVKPDRMIQGVEYFFFFENHYCTGFFINSQFDMISIRNGYFFYSGISAIGNRGVCPFDEATIDAGALIGYAAT